MEPGGFRHPGDGWASLTVPGGGALSTGVENGRVPLPHSSRTALVDDFFPDNDLWGLFLLRPCPKDVESVSTNTTLKGKRKTCSILYHSFQLTIKHDIMLSI